MNRNGKNKVGGTKRNREQLSEYYCKRYVPSDRSDDDSSSSDSAEINLYGVGATRKSIGHGGKGEEEEEEDSGSERSPDVVAKASAANKAKPKIMAFVRSLRPNSVMGVHAYVRSDTPFIMCCYCHKPFQSKTHVKDHVVANHPEQIERVKRDGPSFHPLFIKHSRPLYKTFNVGAAAGAVQQATDAVQRQEPSAKRARTDISRRQAPVPAIAHEPPRPLSWERLQKSILPEMASATRDAIHGQLTAAASCTVLVDVDGGGQATGTHRSTVGVGALVPVLSGGKGVALKHFVLDTDFCSSPSTGPNTVARLLADGNIAGRLKALCTNAPADLAHRLVHSSGTAIDIVPCTFAALTTTVLAAALHEPAVQALVSRVVVPLLWDLHFARAAAHMAPSAPVAWRAIRYVSDLDADAVSRLNISPVDHVAATILAKLLQPLADPTEFFDREMLTVGTALCVADLIGEHYYSPALAPSASERDSDADQAFDAVVVRVKARAHQAICIHIASVLDTQAGLLATFLDPRTKGLECVHDDAKRTAYLHRAQTILCQRLSPTLSSSSTVPATTTTTTATIAAAETTGLRRLMAASRLVSRPDDDTGFRSQLTSYLAAPAAQIYTAAFEPVDVASWWDTLRGQCDQIAAESRAFRGVLGVCDTRLIRSLLHPKPDDDAVGDYAILRANHHCVPLGLEQRD